MTMASILQMQTHRHHIVKIPDRSTQKLASSLTPKYRGIVQTRRTTGTDHVLKIRLDSDRWDQLDPVSHLNAHLGIAFQDIGVVRFKSVIAPCKSQSHTKPIVITARKETGIDRAETDM